MAPDPAPAMAGADDAWPDPRPAPDPRFDDHAQHAEPAGQEAALPEWAAPSAQWVADPAVDGSTYFARADQDIDFAPPGDLRVVDDAPATAPEGDLAFGGADEQLPEATIDPNATPDYFEIQRRRKARVKPKQNRGPLLTLPRLTAAMVGERRA